MSEEYNPYRAPSAELTKNDMHVPTGKMYTQTMLENLKKTKPWVRFIAVLGFISVGFMILAAVIMVITSRFIGSSSEFGFEQQLFLPIILLYVILAGLYIIPLIFLTKYANSIRDLLNSGETACMENALRYQKSFWKFCGISTIVGIAAGIIFVIIAVVIAASSTF